MRNSYQCSDRPQHSCPTAGLVLEGGGMRGAVNGGALQVCAAGWGGKLGRGPQLGGRHDSWAADSG